MGIVRVNSITINSVSDGPFAEKSTITSIDLGQIPWTTGYMNNSFRNCKNLTSISNFPNNITSIKDGTFHSCTNLTTLPKLPNSIVSIQGGSSFVYDPFYGSGINNTDFLPDHLIAAAYCFHGANAITTINYLPNSLYGMSNTFSSCKNLTTIAYLPRDVTQLSGTFMACTNLTTIPPIPAEVLYINDCFSSCSNLANDIYIYSSRIVNANNCFNNTSLPKNVYIPYNSQIDRYSSYNTYNAFMNAGYNLSTIKNGVTIKENPHFEFAGDWWWCNYDGYLHKYLNSTTPTVFTIPNSINGKTTHLLSGTFCSEYNIIASSSTITDINMNNVKVANCFKMFFGCSSLCNITNFNSSQLSNAVNMFYGCTSLVSIPINFPEYLSSLYCTFYGCSKLVSVPNIPKAVTSMSNAFYGCSNLTSIPIVPQIVTQLVNTFRGCSNLTNIYIQSNRVINATNCFYPTSSATQNRRNVYIPFINSDGTPSATYTAFTVAGYKTDGSYQNVYLINYAGLY